MKEAKPNRTLTDAELEIMTVLWRLGEGKVADVMDALAATKKLAYTSVSTILRILEQKQVVSSRKNGRSHIYVPNLSKSEYESLSLHRLVSRVFEGQPLSLVRTLIDTQGLDEKELEDIQRLLAERVK